MSAPDMSDVARLVTADDPPPAVIDRAQQTVEWAGVGAVPQTPAEIIMQAVFPHAWDYTTDGVMRHHLLSLAEKAAAALTHFDYALVRLPEPTEGDDGDRFWHIGRRPDHTVLAAIDPDGTPRVEACDPENLLEMRPDSARLLAARLLAAADVAERLADEHNTAAQDAEETSRG